MDLHTRIAAALDAHSAHLRALHTLIVQAKSSACVTHERSAHTSGRIGLDGKTSSGVDVGVITQQPSSTDTAHAHLQAEAEYQYMAKALQALSAPLNATLRELVEAIGQGAVTQNGVYRPWIISGADRTEPWITIGMVDDRDRGRVLGHINPHTQRDVALYAAYAAAFSTGIGTGPHWRVEYGNRQMCFDLQAPTITEAIEWAALLECNAILSEPDMHLRVMAIQEPVDLPALLAGAHARFGIRHDTAPD